MFKNLTKEQLAVLANMIRKSPSKIVYDLRKDNMSDIKGYRTLTEEEIITINEIKTAGENISALIDNIKATPGVDQRWLSIGITQLQQGFMSLTRSVARPTNF